MIEKACKSDIVPTETPTLTERVAGPNACLHLCVNRYAGWTAPGYDLMKEGVGDTRVQIPPFVNFVYLGEADAADPLNQLRTLTVRIADRLAYKVVLTDAASMPEHDRLLLLIGALFGVGVDQSAEIRDAIAAERKARLTAE